MASRRLVRLSEESTTSLVVSTTRLGVSTLLSPNEAGLSTPLVVALTLYPPNEPLAVAVTEAAPPEIVAVVAERVADAPVAGGVNVRIPPLTGSRPLSAVTETARGLVNAALMGAVWLSPPVTVSVKPWVWTAPRSTAPLRVRDWPRWSMVSPLGMRAVLPTAMAGLPGNGGIVWVGPP